MLDTASDSQNQDTITRRNTLEEHVLHKYLQSNDVYVAMTNVLMKGNVLKALFNEDP